MPTLKERRFRTIDQNYNFELIEIRHEEIKTKKKNPKTIMKELLFKMTTQRYQNDNFEISYDGKFNTITTYEEHSKFPNEKMQEEKEIYMTIYELEENWNRGGLHP